MKLSRLEVAITVFLVGFLADWSITQWMIYGLTGFSESNMTLLPEVGVPLMVRGEEGSRLKACAVPPL